MNVTRKLMLKRSYNAEPTEVVVEMDVDIERLVERVGSSAWRNKSKRAYAMHNIIKATARQSIASKEQQKP